MSVMYVYYFIMNQENEFKDKTYIFIKTLFIIKSINREIKTRPIYDCRCDERLEPKYGEFTCLTYTGLVEELEYLTKDRDELNRREVCECDG
jgi:hypothetical protein